MNYFDIVELTLVQDPFQANRLLKQGWKLINVSTYTDREGIIANYILGKPSYLDLDLD